MGLFMVVTLSAAVLPSGLVLSVEEIYAQGDAADEEAFGYQEAWADYRYKPSKVTGLKHLRSHPAGHL
jgi:hypothetical protein